MSRPRRTPGRKAVVGAGQVIAAPFGGACLRAGFDSVGDALRVTLGPTARTVLVERLSRVDAPEALDDAATVARRLVELPVPKNTGAMLMRQLVWQVYQRSGDGTATAAVIAQSLLRECARHIAAGAHPVRLRRGIEAALASALTALEGQAIPVSGTAILRSVALAASRDEALADTIADLHTRYGHDIVITVQEWQANALHVEVADGAKWDAGYASPSFVNDPARGLAWAEQPAILLTNVPLERAEQLLPVMQRVVATGIGQFVVIAPAIGEAALAALLVNNERGALHSLGILAPGLGDHRAGVLGDLAALTGGRVIADQSGAAVEQATPDDLGRCRLVWASRDFFSVIDGAGDPAAIGDRLRQVRAALEREEVPFEREQLRLRLGRLRGGVAVLGVGAATKADMLERRVRAERAVRAVEAARREGVVPGGGAALLAGVRAIQAAVSACGLEERLGAQAMARALVAPLRTIVANAGADPGPVVAALREAGDGWTYDAIAHRVVDARAAGILDPLGVVRTALRAGVSTAVMAMLTDTIVIPRQRPAKPE